MATDSIKFLNRFMNVDLDKIPDQNYSRLADRVTDSSTFELYHANLNPVRQDLFNEITVWVSSEDYKHIFFKCTEQPLYKIDKIVDFIELFFHLNDEKDDDGLGEISRSERQLMQTKDYTLYLRRWSHPNKFCVSFHSNPKVFSFLVSGSNFI